MNTINLNNPDKTAFQAKLDVKVPVKNIRKLLEVDAQFQKATKKFPDDTLTISMCPNANFRDYEVAHISEKMDGVDFAISHIIPDFDKMLNTLTEAQLVKKLKNYFFTLAQEEEINNICKGINQEIARLQKVKAHNLELADLYAKDGRIEYAKIYAVLARNNQGRINSLQTEKIAKAKTAFNSLIKTANTEADLNHVPQAYESKIFETEI